MTARIPPHRLTRRTNLTRLTLLTGPVLTIAAAVVLAGCASNSPATTAVGTTGGGAGSGDLTVSSTDTECRVSAGTAPAGNLVFHVTNDGAKVTEFYLLDEDGLSIVGEVENIGPGLSRDLVVRAVPGSYLTTCKPGMVGPGIRTAFSVTDSGKDVGPAMADKELVEQANTQYASYVKVQAEQLKATTTTFVELYKGGKNEAARDLYAQARQHWERIEPVAESFGDLDPRMDLREADLEPGQKWTGWHVIEKDLWPPATGYKALTAAQRTAIADQLKADTDDLHSRTRTITFTTDQIGNGAKSLLDEVATGKVTGEEELWSHTDLYDFQANVDGARIAWEGLRPLLAHKDAALDAQIQLRFSELQKLLGQHRSGNGFVSYKKLSKPEVKSLSDAVNALSEPLSRLTAAVLS